MKRFFFLLFCFFPLILISCATSNPVYTAIAGNGGQVFFLRPLTLDTKLSMVSQIDLDVTVNAKGGVFTQAPILNYTLTMPIEQVQYADTIQINIANNTTVVRSENRIQLFKDISGKKYIDLRYSVTLNSADFSQVLQSNDTCFIEVIGPDGTIESLESKDFNLRMRNLRLMVL